MNQIEIIIVDEEHNILPQHKSIPKPDFNGSKELEIRPLTHFRPMFQLCRNQVVGFY